MSSVQAVPAAKFLRKTTLRETEANTKFRMLDDDVAEAITSAEADEVTPLMSKVYTRLLLTPYEMREGERVLRFTGQEREGKWVTAWEQLRGHLRVSGETASKALRWMHQQGIIGYYAGKNGVGIRIFLNRAASSVVERRGARAQKNLSSGRAPNCGGRTSSGATPFKDSFAVSEGLDVELNPRAPKNGAGETFGGKSPSERGALPKQHHSASSTGLKAAACTTPSVGVTFDEVITRLRYELEPMLQDLVRQAAMREHEYTREWLESKGLPKAVRVAQRETYNVLRSQGAISGGASRGRADAGRIEYVPPTPRAITEGEVCELAEACLALLETKGQSIEVTLSEMCAAAGGFLLPDDASRVLEKAEALLGRPMHREGKR